MTIERPVADNGGRDRIIVVRYVGRPVPGVGGAVGDIARRTVPRAHAATGRKHQYQRKKNPRAGERADSLFLSPRIHRRSPLRSARCSRTPGIPTWSHSCRAAPPVDLLRGRRRPMRFPVGAKTRLSARRHAITAIQTDRSRTVSPHPSRVLLTPPRSRGPVGRCGSCRHRPNMNFQFKTSPSKSGLKKKRTRDKREEG